MPRSRKGTAEPSGTAASGSLPQAGSADTRASELTTALAEHGESPAVIHVDATVAHGEVRRDHGMAVLLTGQINQPYSSTIGGDFEGDWGSFQGTLDVHGNGLFAALPNGLGSVAQMLLPLSARIDQARGHENMWAATLVLGAKKLSRGRLESTLSDIVAAGDPPFCFELRATRRASNHPELVGFLPTRASLLQQGLAHPRQRSVRDDGPLADFRRSFLRQGLGVLRWWLCPLLFLAASWQLFLQPERILPHIPQLLGAADGRQVSVAAVLPPHPTSMAEAFRLGALHAQMQQLQLSAADSSQSSAALLPPMAELLREASQVLGDRTTAQGLTQHDMDAMLDEIVRFEAHVGVVYRVLGFFTFVNTVWLFAILGITVSIGPSIYHLLRPLHTALKEAMRWLYLKVILPNVIRCHTWGVFEALAWTGCWFGLAQGMQIKNAVDVGEMVSLTASCLTAPALCYTTLLRGKRMSQERLLTLCQLYFALDCFPWALCYSSSLYGYLVVVSVYGALGFGVWAYPLCLAIGFSSENSMHRVCVSSMVLVALFVGLTAGGVQPELLAPFAGGVGTFGTVMLLLSLLIISSQHYHRDNSSMWYYTNGLMVVCLLCLSIAGNILGLTGMANAATTFTCLWLLEKYAEFHLECKWSGWVLLLLISLAAWRASLWLHSNPGHIISMFS